MKKTLRKIFNRKAAPRRVVSALASAALLLPFVAPPSFAPVPHGMAVKSDAGPQWLNAFGETAYGSTPSGDPFNAQWKQMLAQQNKMMQVPAFQQGYAAFLAQFDDLRGLPLADMAFAVNDRVREQITYMKDTQKYKGKGTWAPPAYTAQFGIGDCEDYANLQYAIMRYLDVPQNRLFVASVNTQGKSNYNHAVLLLDVAEEGQTPDYMVMNNYGFLSNRTGVLSTDWLSGWKLYSARNMGAVWKANLAVTPKQADVGRKSPKIG